MPLPKAYRGVLQSATSDIIAAATHATAQLVLHLTGEQRLTRDQVRDHVAILKELVAIEKEDRNAVP